MYFPGFQIPQSSISIFGQKLKIKYMQYSHMIQRIDEAITDEIETAVRGKIAIANKWFTLIFACFIIYT